jgi:hypothetical protein
VRRRDPREPHQASGAAGFVEEDDEDFEADSGESDSELGQRGDDDVVEIKPFAAKRNFSRGTG